MTFKHLLKELLENKIDTLGPFQIEIYYSDKALIDQEIQQVLLALKVNTSVKRVEPFATNNSGQRCLDFDAFKILAEVLLMNKTIEVISSSVQQHYLFYSMEIFAKSLKSNTGLRELNLTRGGISDAGMKALGDALIQNSTLKKITFTHMYFTEKGAASLAQAFETNRTLSIELNECTFEGNAELVLQQSIIKHNLDFNTFDKEPATLDRKKTAPYNKTKDRNFPT